MNFQEIATLIQFHRKKAGLSRNQLADLADVGKTVVFDIEHGLVLRIVGEQILSIVDKNKPNIYTPSWRCLSNVKEQN